MEENNIEFPLTFTQCPNCGSTRRISDEVVQSEKAEGRIPTVQSSCLFQQQSLIAPPDLRFITAKVIMWSADGCADCGTVYVTYAKVETATPQMVQQKRPPQGPFRAN